MGQTDTITKRQFVAIAFVALLSPMIRRFPRLLAGTAGRTAWLSVPLSLPLVLLALLGFWLLFRNLPEGTGFAGLLTQALGDFSGRALTGLYALWLTAYAGFLLRSGADRLVSTVYPGAAAGVFIVGMALCCAVAAAGSLKTLGRSAMLLRPLLAALPVLVFLLTFKDAEFSLLLPVTTEDLAPCGVAALKSVNLLGVAAYLAFCGDRIKDGKFRVRDFAGWIAALLVIVMLITAGCIGMFGPELTAKMTHPFFMLTRDVTILGAMERVEPAAVAVWVFADFIMISMLLWIAARNWYFCFAPAGGATEREERHVPWLPLLCTALAIAGAFLLPQEEKAFSFLSDTVVPLCNAGMAFGLPLLVLAVGKLRKKL